MCKPHRCPHINMTGITRLILLHSIRTNNDNELIFPYFVGNICVYCPGGPDSDFEYSTQSYTGYEPTSMRAIRARYDPYEQTRSRVEQVSIRNLISSL